MADSELVLPIDINIDHTRWSLRIFDDEKLTAEYPRAALGMTVVRVLVDQDTYALQNAVEARRVYTPHKHLGTLAINRLVLMETDLVFFGHAFTEDGKRVQSRSERKEQAWHIRPVE
jgi:hypothetical protein